MVVFEDGKPKKNDYRKFRIREVSGPDDYGAMEEMLTRRFEHSRRKGWRKMMPSGSCRTFCLWMVEKGRSM